MTISSKVKFLIDEDFISIQLEDEELYSRLLDFFSEKDLSEPADSFGDILESFKVELKDCVLYFDLIKK